MWTSDIQNSLLRAHFNKNPSLTIIPSIGKINARRFRIYINGLNISSTSFYIQSFSLNRWMVSLVVPRNNVFTLNKNNNILNISTNFGEKIITILSGEEFILLSGEWRQGEGRRATLILYYISLYVFRYG